MFNLTMLMSSFISLVFCFNIKRCFLTDLSMTPSMSVFTGFDCI